MLIPGNDTAMAWAINQSTSARNVHMRQYMYCTGLVGRRAYEVLDIGKGETRRFDRKIQNKVESDSQGTPVLSVVRGRNEGMMRS